MSNWMLSKETITSIANLISKELGLFSTDNSRKWLINERDKKLWLLIAKRNGAVFNDKAKDFTDDSITKAIYKSLYELNLKAVNDRYNRQDNYFENYVENKYFENNYTIQQFKNLQCFIYNCDFDTTTETRIYKLLRELENNFAIYLIGQMEEYKKAKWGGNKNDFNN